MYKPNAIKNDNNKIINININNGSICRVFLNILI